MKIINKKVSAKASSEGKGRFCSYLSHIGSIAFCREQDWARLEDLILFFDALQDLLEPVSAFRLHNQEECVLSKETIDVSHFRPFLQVGVSRSFVTGPNFDHCQSNYHLNPPLRGE